MSTPPRSSAEWPFAALLVALVLLLSASLALYAYLSTPPDRYFSGVFYNIPDHNQYFAWMRDLQHEHLAPNRLTPEPNEPALFHLLWLVAGRVGALFELTPGAIFGTLRILAVLFLFPVAFACIHIMQRDALQRRWAMLLFSFGGGLGVIWVVVKYWQNLPDAPFPFDIYTSEANSFFIALAFPHFGIALALVLAVIGLTLYAQQRQQLRYAVAAGCFAALVGLQHAYDLLTIYSVLGLWGLLIWWRDRRFPLFLGKTALIIAACSIPPAAYLTYLVLTDPTWGGKLDQFDNAGAWTPPPLHLAILMGMPLFLALLAFRPRMLRSQDDSEILVAIWFLAHFVLAYLPVKFQIHLLLGWQLPIALLAARALHTQLGPWLRARVPKLASVGLATIVGLCLITNAYIFAWRFYDLSRHDHPFYLSQDEVAALTWLGQRTSRADVVLGTLEINQHVPVWSDAHAFLAHWAGTLDFFVKSALVAEVLDPATPEHERQAVLAQFGVSYVIVREDDAPREVLASAAPSLQPVFTQGTVSIFAVDTIATPPDGLTSLSSERRELRFTTDDGTILAGELNLPSTMPPRALVVIVHHSGPVDRTSYAYMAEQLLPAGYAVFRFDKRGNGASGGRYGCCEASDALAAYAAATQEPDMAGLPVLIVAQSIGTQYLAEDFAAYQRIRPPQGVALLSSLLSPEAITAVAAPVHVIIADSEPELERIGPNAVAAHQAALPYGASLYIAAHAEHTLFDISDGPIDWDDPAWATRFHRGAMASLLAWMEQQTEQVNR